MGALLVWIDANRHPRLQNVLAVTFSLAAGAAALGLAANSSSQVSLSVPVGGVFGDFTFLADGLGVFLAAIATIIGSLAVIFSIDYMRGDPELGRYYSLVLIFIGAMAGLVLTSSLMLMFVFWEITALCSYGLISFHNDDPKAVRGGIKALIITQLGGIGLLGGALLVYASLGTYEIGTLLQNAHSLPQASLALMAFGFLAAAAAKSAQFPFQTWLPDAMEAPSPVSALIHAATMVNAGVYLLARFYPAFEAVPGWKTAVVAVGVVSALMAAVMALFADDLKRLLAYSTVSQLGYMVYAIGVGGIFASQFHLLSHAIFKALLFLAAGAVIHTTGTRALAEMGGLGSAMPRVRFVFITGALALAGFPVLNGFWSKELILEYGLAGGPGWGYGLMLLTAGLTALYSIRCVWLVFYGERRGTGYAHDAHTAMQVALWPLAAGSWLSWLLAGPLGALFVATLPFHHMEAATTPELIAEILRAPATWLAVGIVLCGLAAWWLRARLAPAARLFGWLEYPARNSFGFEAFNQAVVRFVQEAAERLRRTQTGFLSFNLAGILAGLAILLAILAWGG
jgi:NADH-quinone oxidoreductase subunit L